MTKEDLEELEKHEIDFLKLHGVIELVETKKKEAEESQNEGKEWLMNIMDSVEGKSPKDEGTAIKASES